MQEEWVEEAKDGMKKQEGWVREQDVWVDGVRGMGGRGKWYGEEARG